MICIESVLVCRSGAFASLDIGLIEYICYCISLGWGTFKVRGNMKIFKNIEKTIIIALTGMMALILLLATIDLARKIVEELLSEPDILVDIDGLFSLFGSFLVVLIGIELLETIKAYLRDDVVHVEIVLLVAIIAIARKVIVLEYDESDPLTIMGIGILVVALASGYYFIKNAGTGHLRSGGNVNKERHESSDG